MLLKVSDSFLKVSPMFNSSQHALFDLMLQISAQLGNRVFVVGGTIRDLFLGQNFNDRDIDFIIEGDARIFAKTLVEHCGGKLKVFDGFMTAKILEPNNIQGVDEIDLASSRCETYGQPGQLPNVSIAPVRDDLQRRDFTINALAVELSALSFWSKNTSGDIPALKTITMDLFNGIDDLNKKIVRILHNRSFEDDPTRLFRACRYAGRIGAEFDALTKKRALEAVNCGALRTISKSRILNEVKKIIAEKNVSGIFAKLKEIDISQELGLFEVDKQDLLVDDLQKLRQLSGLSELLIFQVAVRLMFIYCGDQAFCEKRYGEYGFGSKEIKKIVADTDLKDESPDLRRVSDAGIIFRLLKAEANENHLYLSEVKARGLIQ